MSTLTEEEITTNADGLVMSPEEIDREYKDTCSKKRRTGDIRKEGADTAVMGMRMHLDMPYWINNVLIVNDDYLWFWEGLPNSRNAGLQKFGQIFPEFVERNLITDMSKELERLKWLKDHEYLWDTPEKAEAYLKKGMDRWTTR